VGTAEQRSDAACRRYVIDARRRAAQSTRHTLTLVVISDAARFTVAERIYEHRGGR
jgi:hypothetical protein